MSDSYSSIADAADSGSLQRRVTACAAQQGVEGDAWSWAWETRYTWASSPGWGAAWDSALASENPDPGADPAVITDQMILSQVQGMLG